MRPLLILRRNVKALAAFLAILLLVLAGSFTYAHRKFYQHRFEHDLMEQAAQALKADPNFNQVGVSFDGLDARLSGVVAVPALRDQARQLVDALPGARALPVRNEIRVPSKLRFSSSGNGTAQATGWLPAGEWRDAFAGLFATALPQLQLDLSGVQTDPSVMPPTFAQSSVLPELLVGFFSVTTNGILGFENGRIHLQGKVRSETDKIRLLASASRIGSLPGEWAVDNYLEVVNPLPARPVVSTGTTARPTAGGPTTTSVAGGNDLAGILRGLPIYFDSGSTQLQAGEQAKVDQAAAAIRRLNPQARLQVLGFADPSGKAAVNQRLSLKRAEAVAARLVARGVPKRSIDVRVGGVAKTSGAQGRRVEVVLASGGGQ